MKIIILNISEIPIYEQIKEQIREAILSGELAENELLPSLRALARDLKVSVLTITRAYDDLEKDGYIINVHGKGSYVRPKGSEIVKEQFIRNIEEKLEDAVNIAIKINLTYDDLTKILKIIMEENENG